MCGIVAVVSRPSTRAVPAVDELLALLDAAVAAPTLSTAADAVARVDTLLKGVPGVLALLGDADLAVSIVARLDQLDARAAERERELDGSLLPADELERANAELIELLDACWAVRRDRLRTAAAVGALAGPDPGRAAIGACLSIQQALSSIDRMEVRGRDSAGIHLFVWDHGLVVHDPGVAAEIERRAADPLFQNGTVRVDDDRLGFVYKAAAEIGELGDNVRALREAITADASCCVPPWRRRRRGCRSSGTPAGRASGSSASRTAIPSTATRRPAAPNARTPWPCSTATSTTTPI